ncbi:Avirulence (Avh) protein [Phytophthora megakarya]|uniref:RxLR effector protein n=1 Tax=Phytophthora megakarya TaxID=4795 RepID=A0A225V3J6_9STRA|nr:Avirulence (Avh) protein [Phytophthora megakarya]
MHLSQVLVVGVASFLFASEAIAVAMNSNQAKTLTVERDQRSLRSYSKPVEDDSDDFDDFDDLDSLDDTEERGGNPTVQDLAKKWGQTVNGITTGAIKLTDDQYTAWRAAVNEGIETSKKAKRVAANAAWHAANGIKRRT